MPTSRSYSAAAERNFALSEIFFGLPKLLTLNGNLEGRLDLTLLRSLTGQVADPNERLGGACYTAPTGNCGFSRFLGDSGVVPARSFVLKERQKME